MTYLHSKNVVHGNLALHNVLLSKGTTGEVVAKVRDIFLLAHLQISDFGIRKMAKEPLPFGNSPLVRWSSPEMIFASGQATLKSDVWMFGGKISFTQSS